MRLLALIALRFFSLDAVGTQLAPAELDDEQHRPGVDRGHGSGGAEQGEDAQQSRQHHGSENACRQRLAKDVLGMTQNRTRIAGAQRDAEVVEDEADDADDYECENVHVFPW